jgi:hypothetical protein
MELKEIIRHLWRSSHLTSSLQAQNEDVEHETVILEDKSQKLESTNHTILALSGPVRSGFLTIFGKTCDCDQSQKVRMLKNCDWTGFDRF